MHGLIHVNYDDCWKTSASRYFRCTNLAKSLKAQEYVVRNNANICKDLICFNEYCTENVRKVEGEGVSVECFGAAVNRMDTSLTRICPDKQGVTFVLYAHFSFSSRILEFLLQIL
jgi:hypothetical protein